MLEKIKKNIIFKIKTLPFEIKGMVIFGSLTKEGFKKDSDIDILIVSDNVNPKKHKRGREIADIKEWLSLDYPMDIMLLTQNECISNFKNHNPLFLDIASEGIILLDKDNFLMSLFKETKSYISKRKITKIKDGWMFPVKAKKEVLLSNVSNKDFAIAMFNDGKRDYEIGVHILEYGFFDKAVYHFQQAAEKAIKAVLACFGIFHKTHFVGEVLIRNIEKREIETQWKEKLIHIGKISTVIEPEVTWSRYPGIDNNELWIPANEYTVDDAIEVKTKCEDIINIDKGFIKIWFK